MMNSIAFIDIEVDPVSRSIIDIGCVLGDGSSFHSNAIDKFIEFLKGTQFICGHNMFNHDLPYIQKEVADLKVNANSITSDSLNMFRSG
jgi:ATP-dependent DNA helicase RecQ